MAGANYYQHSSSKGVNVKICGQVSSFQRTDIYQVSCLLVIELLEFKKNNMDKWEKNFSSNLKRKWYLVKDFVQFCFYMFYALMSSEVVLT